MPSSSGLPGTSHHGTCAQTSNSFAPGLRRRMWPAKESETSGPIVGHNDVIAQVACPGVGMLHLGSPVFRSNCLHAAGQPTRIISPRQRFTTSTRTKLQGCGRSGDHTTTTRTVTTSWMEWTRRSMTKTEISSPAKTGNIGFSIAMGSAAIGPGDTVLCALASHKPTSSVFLSQWISDMTTGVGVYRCTDSADIRNRQNPWLAGQAAGLWQCTQALRGT
jgi:hypothetical protein